MKTRLIHKTIQNMATVLLAVSFSLIFCKVSAQFDEPCLPEGITFSTQAEIDSFQINYPNCSKIAGDLRLFGGESITNLNGLNVLTSIGGNLDIHNCDVLTGLSGLENLKSIYGNLIIGYPGGLWGSTDNPSLISLSGLEDLALVGGNLSIMNNETLNNIEGLEKLDSIGGNLYIGYNDALLSMAGLENLDIISGDLTIRANDSLTNLTGLDNLTSLSGKLEISWNRSLVSLAGLENVDSIGGDFFISYNYSTVSLSGLDNLIAIDGDFNISGNDVLTNLTGLDKLTSIGGEFRISGNDLLISLTGLDNLVAIGGNFYIGYHDTLLSIAELNNLAAIGGNLSIVNNTALSICDLPCLCAYLSDPKGAVSIHGNAQGCNSPPEVASACDITLSCLPYGNYYFFNQYDIDSFQTNYPGCIELKGLVRIKGDDITNLTGLNAVSAIPGDIEIVQNVLLTSLAGFENVVYIGGDLIIGGPYGQGNPSLTSLSGLENLFSIGGDLGLAENDSLISLSGLNNLTTIEGALNIGMHSHHDMHGNAALINLSGLDNLTTIGSDILILNNNSLNSLSGLESITSIEGAIQIRNNPSLSSLAGLENLTYIGDFLWLYSNNSLTSFTGLENLTSIGGKLDISSNDALTSLTGLNSVTSIGGDIKITNNVSLSTCAVQGICNCLANPNGIIDIFNNATGCNSTQEVAGNCGITLPCLPFGNYRFSSQADIDNFQSDFPDCTELEGNVTISGSDITNLDGLDVVTAIGGTLDIGYNEYLTSISGIENLDAVTINELIIVENPFLSECEVQSICEYLLLNPNAEIIISGNAIGCNSQQEVKEACEVVSIEEINLHNRVTIIPNPFSSSATIKIESVKNEKMEIEIYNQNGVLIQTSQMEFQPGKQSFTWDASSLPSGIYFIRIQNGNESITRKMIKPN